ncbi:MAG: replication factor C large subunit [Thermoplasmatota archaeon]
MDWTEKYRPKSLSDMVGNGPAVARLKAWGEAWRRGEPPVRALILAGPPGTGKTSAALALAADMGWVPIELNASDARNADTIRRVATAGAVHETFGPDGSFRSARGPEGRKLIILDEADNLYERQGGEDASGGDLSDRGGKTQIVETVRQTRQPMILIVNDLYALQKGSGSALRGLAEEVKFQHLQARSIAPALERLAKLEGVAVPRDVIELMAERAKGDLRAAVRDLEGASVGRTTIGRADLAAVGARDANVTMHELLRDVLKGRALDELRREVMDSDASPEDLVLWVDENLARHYVDPNDLVRGYEILSKADRYLGRTKSTQDYGLWRYASELATLGVMVARENPPGRDYQPIGFPQWLMRMSRTKGVRQTKDAVAEGLGRATHQSRRKARLEQVEPFALLFARDREFAVEQARRLALEEEEIALLLGPAAGQAKAIREAALVAPEPVVEAATQPPPAGQKRLF